MHEIKARINLLCSFVKQKKNIKAEKEVMKSERINRNAPQTNAENFVEGCRGNVGRGG